MTLVALSQNCPVSLVCMDNGNDANPNNEQANKVGKWKDVKTTYFE